MSYSSYTAPKSNRIGTFDAKGTLKVFQDLLIDFQTKLRKFECISENDVSDNIILFRKSSWDYLTETELQSNITKLIESFSETFRIILTKITMMDNGFVRLTKENKEGHDKLKKMEATLRDLQGSKNKEDIEELKDKIKNYEKKVKRQDEKIDSLTKEHENEISELTKDKDVSEKEKKKLSKKIEELNEKATEVNDLHEIMRNISKEIKEIKDQNSKIEEKKDLEAKIDRLVEASNTKDSHESKWRRDIFQEIKDLNNQNCAEILKEIELTKEEVKLVKMKDEAFDRIRAKCDELIKKSLLEENDKKEYLRNNLLLEEELVTLKKQLEIKQTSLNIMKEKIKTFNCFENSAEQIEKLKREVQQSNKEKILLQDEISALKNKIRERFEELEQLKKDKLRLESEMDNLKKIIYTMKSEGLPKSDQ